MRRLQLVAGLLMASACAGTAVTSTAVTTTEPATTTTATAERVSVQTVVSELDASTGGVAVDGDGNVYVANIGPARHPGVPYHPGR
jgi:ABC-type glycerol-3-phosphate transport system substrate-binding protein